MTLAEAAPYTSRVSGSEDRRAVSERQAISRHLLIAPLFALAACATNDPSKSELHELRARLRAIREDNVRLERRVDRLELSERVGSASKRGASAPPGLSPEVPLLTVVKLKPRVEPASKVDTRVSVVEPAVEVLDELARSAPAKDVDDEVALDPEVGEQTFEAGLLALKTGNVVGGIERLQRFAVESPKHPKADNALYFAGVGLIGLNDLEDAARAFEQLIEAYPAGDVVADGLLKLAECRVRLNQPREASAIYHKVVSGYPGTQAANLAESRLGTLARNSATESPKAVLERE